VVEKAYSVYKNFQKTVCLIYILSFFNFSECSFSAEKPSCVKIDLVEHTLFFLEDSKVVSKYPIGIAKSKEFLTPIGTYKVETKDIDPGWINPFNQTKLAPGKDNPLGTRWIGFYSQNNSEYGIHGTNNPDSIGKNVSHGCIRMLNADVEDLFNRVKIGTPVIVYYERFQVVERNGDLILMIEDDPLGIQPLSMENIEKKVLKKYPKAELNKQAIKSLIQTDNPVNKIRLIGTWKSNSKT
jgi:L,D-transpeptidase ErfK/SrfK